MDVLQNLIHQTAFFNGTMDWRSYVMILVAFLFLYLAIKKGYEPLLLVPIAMGMLLVNIYPQIMEEGGLLSYFFKLDEWSVLPSLIFLGVGAMTDFAPLIANPKSFLLGAAAQFGILRHIFWLLSWDSMERRQPLSLLSVEQMVLHLFSWLVNWDRQI